MKPEKFWDLVEEHEWLPAVVLGQTNFDEEPVAIGCWLKPYSIRTSIEYIAFRPFESLSFDEVPVQDEKEEDGNGLTVSTHLIVYWHEVITRGLLPPDNQFSKQEVSKPGNKPRSVVDLMEALAKKRGALDAVVRVTYKEYYDLHEGVSDPAEKLLLALEKAHFDLGVEGNLVRSYDIFLPR